MTGFTNALADETSPYLLQHADNPVQWYPWGETALTLAREQDKPILLSVGYSACHWCHVMAHESFEHAPTAKLMNELFVNIKVDREERPDLDKIYQLAHQLLTQRPGGWPLTAFLTPDTHEPYFVGTYFPIQARYGMPSFTQVLTQMESVYRTRGDDIAEQNRALAQALSNLEPGANDDAILDHSPLVEARRILGGHFEPSYGGFGGAPKFPHCTNLERLLRDYAQSVCNGAEHDDEALHMATFTLMQMCRGGIYDQIGGGFCRYSVDDRWMIPHFEKMLYDNGPLLALCAECSQVVDQPLFTQVARETAQWVMREMQSPAGGYYSTLDADSEGVEGKYYVWTPEQVESVLSADEYAVFSTKFGLNDSANFEEEFWHLHAYHDNETLARETDQSVAQVDALIDAARAKLFVIREQRVRPGLDDKILTAWNGLMIKGMAIAGRVLDDDRMLDSATRALDYVREVLWVDGALLATSKDGTARLPAYLDDYAFMIDAVLNLLQSRWRDGELEFAVELADGLLERFEDRDTGGFFFTAHDHEQLMHRHKPLSDDAVPSGNGIAAQMLGRLGHLLGETRYLQAAERTLKVGWDAMTRAPHAFNALLLALEETITPPQTIIIRGDGEDLRSWQQRCTKRYAPRRMTLAISNDAKSLPGLLSQRVADPAGPIAYVCEGHVCDAPIKSIEALEEALKAAEVKSVV